MDGHPFRPVAPGSAYRYAFPVQDRGGTYWYHPHPHGGTAHQTYAGLAGFLLIEDEDERTLSEALDLRLGKTDIPLLIQDKVLDEDGTFVYEPDAMAVDMGYGGGRHPGKPDAYPLPGGGHQDLPLQAAQRFQRSHLPASLHESG
jgi:FtsP/CotA-like multicopper oxidase with cupredoxin domain